jgi:hypothetical protein
MMQIFVMGSADVNHVPRLRIIRMVPMQAVGAIAAANLTTLRTFYLAAYFCLPCNRSRGGLLRVSGCVTGDGSTINFTTAFRFRICATTRTGLLDIFQIFFAAASIHFRPHLRNPLARAVARLARIRVCALSSAFFEEAFLASESAATVCSNADLRFAILQKKSAPARIGRSAWCAIRF